MEEHWPINKAIVRTSVLRSQSDGCLMKFASSVERAMFGGGFVASVCTVYGQSFHVWRGLSVHANCRGEEAEERADRIALEMPGSIAGVRQEKACHHV